MAKVTSPLFGLDADGTIGKSVVYARWKGVRYARRYTVGANPNTLAQQQVRSLFTFLNHFYKLSPAIVRQPWEAKAAGEPLTGPNAFVKANAAYMKTDTDLSHLSVSTVVLGGLSPSAAIISGGAGQVSITLTPPILPEGWAIHSQVLVAIHDQDPHLDFTSQVHYDVDNTAPFNTTIAGLSAGSWYAAGYFKFLRADGHIAWGPALSDIVVVT